MDSSRRPRFWMCSSDDTFGPAVRGCRDDFDFTLRFEHIVLLIVPSVLFIVASIYRIKQLSRCVRVVNGGLLQWAKLAVISVYFALRLTLLVLLSKSGIRSQTTALAAEALSVLVALTSLGLSWTEHSRSLRPSIFFNLYLFVTLLLDATYARTLLTISSSWALGRLFTAAACLKGAILLLESYSKVRWALLEQSSPESSIGIFSITTYSWLNHLALLGSRKVLNVNDLYGLDPAMASKDIDSKFWAAWNRPSSRGRKMRLLFALLRAMKWQLLAPILPRLAKIGFDFSQPFLINAVQRNLSKSDTSETAREGKALIGATVLIFLGVAASMGIHQYYNMRATAFLRGFLIVGIYRKTTVMGISSDDSKAPVTLMSTDVERLQQAFRNIHEIWANTIELALGAWLLYVQLGLAFLVPIGLVLVCFLGTMVVGRATPQYQKAWVTATQERIGATANLIANMKGLKISGLANQLGNLIQKMREVEIKAGANFRKITVYSIVCAFGPMTLSPVLTFAATSRDVDTTRAFISLSFLRLLTIPLAGLFQILPAMVAASACFDRIAAYLEGNLRSDYRDFGPAESSTDSSETTPPPENEKYMEFNDKTTSAAAISIEDGYFGWKESQYTLHQLDLAIPECKLTMVVGPVGCGKSTFCKALLGEVPFAKGHTFCTSKLAGIGFCDQSPFIPNTSVRNVIVGYGQYDEEWYNKVIDATALWPDIATFASQDQSMVGSNGSNLSGGQRHRLAIARALYARPTISIFDDIFSGLDGPTEELIFDKVFGSDGLLQQLGTTVILCSHAVKHLPSADHIIALGVDGRIVEQGTYEQLLANQSYVHSLDIQDVATISDQIDTATVRETSEPTAVSTTDEFELGDRQRLVGDITVYKRYLSTPGPIVLSLFLILSMGSSFCDNFSTVWLEFWSEYNTNHPGDRSRQGYYLGIYAMLQVLSLVCLTFSIAITTIILVKRSGRIFHLRALRTLVAAPLALFNKMPSGVLLNRFAQDLGIIDVELEEYLSDFIFSVEISIGMAAVIATASPYVAISYPVLGVTLYVLQKFYLRTSRQLRFLDLETKSPLFTHFLETVSSLPTIRAFGWTDSLIGVSHSLIDTSQRPFYLLLVLQTWLTVILALVVAILAVFVVALATQLHGNVGFSGASLVSLMSFGVLLSNIVKTWTQLEVGLGAVSRLESFCTTVRSEHGDGETEQPPESWPRHGAIVIKNVSASYSDGNSDEGQDSTRDGSENRQLALRNLSLSIKAGEKVAIVGRTGSGKSSIILLLLRLLDPLPSNELVMSVDGISLQNIDRNVLRSRIIALPQDAFLLPDGNSYRTNLDPFEEASASECEAALEEVGLWTAMQERGGLDEELKADDLSQGQKQLFSMARAVLRARMRAKALLASRTEDEKDAAEMGGILLLDEVSSNTDGATAALMQRVIRKEFGGYTILAVTHREVSVRDFDRIVVMEKGIIKEDRQLH